MFNTNHSWVYQNIPHLLKFDSRKSEVLLQEKPPLRAAFFNTMRSSHIIGTERFTIFLLLFCDQQMLLAFEKLHYLLYYY